MWAHLRGGDDDDDGEAGGASPVEQAAAEYRLPAELAERLAAAAKRLIAATKGSLEESLKRVEVWPENVDAVRLFLALSTQWRSVGLSAGRHALVVRTGLDYATLPAVAPLVPVDLSPALFGQLRLLEAVGMAERNRIAREAIG